MPEENTSPRPWVPFYIPSQGWAACWRGPKTPQGVGPDGDLYPILHMRWTDGMRPQIEERLKLEVGLICASVNAHSALVEAAKAAVAYDTAIQKCAVNGDVRLNDYGKASASGGDLDALYADWVNKAHAAIALTGVLPRSSSTRARACRCREPASEAKIAALTEALKDVRQYCAEVLASLPKSAEGARTVAARCRVVADAALAEGKEQP